MVALLCIADIVSPPSRTIRYALHQRTTPCGGCLTLIRVLSQLAGGHCGNSRQVPDRGVDPRRRELDVLQFACEVSVVGRSAALPRAGAWSPPGMTVPWAYRHPSYGRFFVVEGKSSWTQATSRHWLMRPLQGL